MSYVILGRAVKSEYLTLATVFGTAGLAYAATSVGKKKTAPGNTPLDQGKDAVPLNAGSSEEEELMNSIKSYIAEAEKDAKH